VAATPVWPRGAQVHEPEHLNARRRLLLRWNRRPHCRSPRCRNPLSVSGAQP